MESEFSENHPALASFSKRRREIFERTVAKFAAKNIELNDVEYVSLIERWISGEIPMSAAASIWDGIKSRRARGAEKAEKAEKAENSYTAIDVDTLPKMTQEQILAEIAKLTE